MSNNPILTAARRGAAEAVTEFFAPTQRVLAWIGKKLGIRQR